MTQGWGDLSLEEPDLSSLGCNHFKCPTCYCALGTEQTHHPSIRNPSDGSGDTGEVSNSARGGDSTLRTPHQHWHCSGRAGPPLEAGVHWPVTEAPGRAPREQSLPIPAPGCARQLCILQAQTPAKEPITPSWCSNGPRLLHLKPAITAEQRCTSCPRVELEVTSL